MAKHSLGTRLKMGSNYIAELTEISGVDMSSDTFDTTTLDVTDGYRRFAGGLKDGGEVGVTGFFNPGDTLGQQALISAFDSGTESAFTIEFPASLGASWSFNGVITGIVTGAALEDPVSFEATIKVSGKPSLGTTASAGISALAFSGGGTLSPAASAGVYNYSYPFTTQTSITVTVTAANHTIKLYVDGAYVQDLTSGAASAAILGFSAASTSKLIAVTAQESGKTPKTYNIVAVRTA